LVALGIGIGSRIAVPRASRSVTTVVNPSPNPAGTKHATTARTEAGAVAAAAETVKLLDGPALLNSARIRELVDRLAASSARDVLARAYEQGAAEARTRLGADTVPAPVVIVRSALVGSRLLSFSPSAATGAVWR